MTQLFHLAFMGRSVRQVGDGPIEYLDGLSLPTDEELDSTYSAAEAAWTANHNPPKRWADTEHFLAEFTMGEMAGIGLSSDPTIAALLVLMSGWRSTVHSDDPRVILGLNALESAGILSEARKEQILKY
jgi:hypothetical protein